MSCKKCKITRKVSEYATVSIGGALRRKKKNLIQMQKTPIENFYTPTMAHLILKNQIETELELQQIPPSESIILLKDTEHTADLL